MGRKHKNHPKKQNYVVEGTKKIKTNDWQQDKRGQKDIYVTQFSNEMFKIFYQRHFNLTYFKDNFAEFQTFWDSLSQPLPVSFRINPTQSNYESLLNKLKSGELVRTLVQQPQEEQIDIGSIIKNVPWFPGNLAWEAKLAKKELRKAVQLQNLHSYIQKCNSTGLLTRQELVSMLPPIFLDPRPGDYVLDMCAAPGSKTCQIVEMIQYYGKGMPDLGGGCVIANDVDSKRAYMLQHQLQRLPTANVVVTNHGAQYFPTLQKDGTRIQFDKILCDVPCTGDGAARKLPTRWLKWSARDGNVIHPLQLSILMRALTMSRKGGYVLYSTCSLNPIEDEAVVSDVFRRVQDGALELIEINDKLPGFIGRRGLKQWPILVTDDLLYKEYSSFQHMKEQGEEKQEKKSHLSEDFFNSLKLDDFIHEIKSLDDKPEISKMMQDNQRSKQAGKLFAQIRDLRPSLFSGDEAFGDKIGINRTMRVLPHDQDTGGFYLALFRKKEHIIWQKPRYSEKVLGSQKFKEQEELFSKIQQNKEEKEQNIMEDLEIDQKKIQSLLSKQDQEEPKQQQLQQNQQIQPIQENSDEEQKNQNKHKAKGEEYIQIGDEDWKTIIDYYGINPDNFKQDQVYGAGQSNLHLPGLFNPVRRFRYITREVVNLIQSDPNRNMKLLNIGCKMFERGKESFGGQVSPFRLCQEGLPYIFPHLTKRLIQCKPETFFFIVEKKNIKESEIPDNEFRENLKIIGNGCFVLHFNQDNINDQIVCQYFKGSVSLMFTNEVSQNFMIRHGKM